MAEQATYLEFTPESEGASSGRWTAGDLKDVFHGTVDAGGHRWSPVEFFPHAGVAAQGLASILTGVPDPAGAPVRIRKIRVRTDTPRPTAPEADGEPLGRVVTKLSDRIGMAAALLEELLEDCHGGEWHSVSSAIGQALGSLDIAGQRARMFEEATAEGLADEATRYGDAPSDYLVDREEAAELERRRGDR